MHVRLPNGQRRLQRLPRLAQCVGRGHGRRRRLLCLGPGRQQREVERLRQQHAYCQAYYRKPPDGKDSSGNNAGNRYNTMAKAQAARAALGPACGGVSIWGTGNACSKTSGGYYWRLCKARGSKTFTFTSSSDYCAWPKSGGFTLKKQ